MKKYLIDLVERTFATFAQGFLAVLIAQHGSANEKTALYTGLTAGALAVGKFLLVKANGFLNTPEPVQPSVADIVKAVEALTSANKAGVDTAKVLVVPAAVPAAEAPAPVAAPEIQAP
jgi:L-asparaginase II